MLKVLLATEDTILERMLTVSFMINGVSVVTATNLGAVTDKLAEGEFNFLLLDGLFAEACHNIREKGFDLPILVFKDSASPELANVEFLSDPNDFLTLRRKMNKMMETKSSSLSVIEHGLMKIDIQKQLVTVKDKMIHLGKVEIAILSSLLKKTGQIVCPDVMRRELENHGQFFNKTIQHNIRELKRVLSETVGDTFQIKRITGRGYQLLSR